jgi:hypothetical protein
MRSTLRVALYRVTAGAALAEALLEFPVQHAGQALIYTVCKLPFNKLR